MRIVFVLCEGSHDVAFLSRVLTAGGYNKYKKTLRQFPAPLNQWLTGISKNLRIEELRLDTMTDDIKAGLPKEALYHPEEDKLVLLYAMNGDKQKDKRSKVISKLREWTEFPDDEKEFSLMEESSDIDNNYGLFVFFDADQKGISARINEAKSELSERFPIAETISENGGIVSKDEAIKIGIYVFADPVKKTGTLEDILLPLMKQGDEKIFEEARAFLDNHYNEDRHYSVVIKKNPEGYLIEKKEKNKYHIIKSIIGVAGQLQNSGFSNTVYIEKSNYLTLEKIRKSTVCQDILLMFSRI